MKILVIYASTEGQTRKIAHFAFDHLASKGHSVALLAASDAKTIDPQEFDAVLLGASVHAGQYQKEFTELVTEKAKTLEGVKTLFLSVSLAAAGKDPEDWQQLANIVNRMTETTGWHPGRVEHVAGAFRFSDYDFFKYWAMRWIESQKDRSGRAGEDREYTDWNALRGLLDDWVEQA
jgi:menaquinone-dependent protoporphyrinogen oxidase